MTDRKARVTVRRATRRDADLLSMIGTAAYAATYADIWEDAAGLVDKLATFRADAFADCLQSANAHTWIAALDGAPVGFLTLVTGVPSPASKREGGAEITRFYLLGPASGQGIGGALFEAALAEATTAGARYLWLDLMAHADWAVKAYTRLGFRVTGRTEMTAAVRLDRRAKRVMEREVG